MDETERLIQTPSALDKNSVETKKLITREFICIYSVLCSAVVGMNSAEVLAGTVRQQYINHWCKTQVNSSIITNFTTTSSCHENKTMSYKDEQTLVSHWEIYFALSLNVCLLLTYAIYGFLSDKYGRKPVMIATSTGIVIVNIVTGIIIYVKAHIAYFIATSILTGIIGSNKMVIFATKASIADLLRDEQTLAVSLSLFVALKAIAEMATEILSGYFIDHEGYLYPQMTSICLTVLALCILLFAFPSRIMASAVDTNSSSTTDIGIRMHEICKMMWKSYLSLFRNLKTRSLLKLFLMLTSVTFLLKTAGVAYIKPLRIFVLGPPFCWTATLYGWLNGGIRACVLIGTLFMKFLYKCFSNDTICSIGLCSGMILCIITACAINTVMIFVGLVPGVLKEIPEAAIAAKLSVMTSTTQQGILFASLEGIDILSHTVFVPVSLEIFSSTENHWRGLIFMLAAVLFGFAFVLIICVRVTSSRRHEDRNLRTVK